MSGMAKLFMNGASQAVRLPKEFRFDADEVMIKRIGSAVLLIPKNAVWDFMGETLGQFGDDFMAERRQSRHIEKRKPLDAMKRKRA